MVFSEVVGLRFSAVHYIMNYTYKSSLGRSKKWLDSLVFELESMKKR